MLTIVEGTISQPQQAVRFWICVEHGWRAGEELREDDPLRQGPLVRSLHAVARRFEVRDRSFRSVEREWSQDGIRQEALDHLYRVVLQSNWSCNWNGHTVNWIDQRQLIRK